MRYAQIRSLDISNGEGVGISLFVQGCHFQCEGCFNEDTWNFSGGREWTNYTKRKFIELANKPYINRISILGGEPLADGNLSQILTLLEELKEKLGNKKIWLFTGYTFEEIVNNANIIWVLEFIDVLVDGRYIHHLRDSTLRWRGSSNQRVIDVNKSLANMKVVKYID